MAGKSRLCHAESTILAAIARLRLRVNRPLYLSTNLGEQMTVKQKSLWGLRAGVAALSLVLIGMASSPTPAAPEKVLLEPTRVQAQSASYVANLLADYHYARPKLNDELSSKIFDQYFKILDGGKSYFLASDIAKFEKFRGALDNSLQSGDLSVAYDIYQVFQARWNERYSYAISLLAEEMKFDTPDKFYFDREKASWVQDKKSLDELWRQRVKNDALNLRLADKAWPEIKTLLEKRYETAKRRMVQVNSEDIFSTFMNAVTSSIDPHATYFSPPQAENFNIEMRLSLEGIGAVLQSDDVYTKVVSLVEMGPADKSKQIKPEDKIVAVGQDNGEMIDVIGWRLDDVVKLIRGKAGTVVRLDVVPTTAGVDGASKRITITREKVKLEDEAAKSKLITVKTNNVEHRVGVITVPKFYIDFDARMRGDKNYVSVSRDVKRLLNEFKAQNVDGVVLDLRNNGGGALDEAAAMTGLFVDAGPVVLEKNQFGQVSVIRSPESAPVWTGPLAVLVNGQSASASEILAAALQDYGRALIVGETTFGKGTVQTVTDLNPLRDRAGDRLGAIKYTVQKFYRITGGSTQHKGVTPDISFPSIFTPEEFGESSLDNALPWDFTTPTRYTSSEGIKKLLPVLSKKSDSRIGVNPEFSYIKSDIQEFSSRKNEKYVSLNLDERKAERERNKQQTLTRENERRARKGEAKLEALPEDYSAKNEQDVFLDESANIVSDMIVLSKQTQLVANDKREPARAQTQ